MKKLINQKHHNLSQARNRVVKLQNKRTLKFRITLKESKSSEDVRAKMDWLWPKEKS